MSVSSVDPRLPSRRLSPEGSVFGNESVFGVELNGERLTVRTANFSDFVRAAPRVARSTRITLRELVPADESLESVFSYLVNR